MKIIAKERVAPLRYLVLWEDRNGCRVYGEEKVEGALNNPRPLLRFCGNEHEIFLKDLYMAFKASEIDFLDDWLSGVRYVQLEIDKRPVLITNSYQMKQYSRDVDYFYLVRHRFSLRPLPQKTFVLFTDRVTLFSDDLTERGEVKMFVRGTEPFKIDAEITWQDQLITRRRIRISFKELLEFSDTPASALRKLLKDDFDIHRLDLHSVYAYVKPKALLEEEI